jgi:uncharacterized protein YjbI with pentapeptide repeats
VRLTTTTKGATTMNDTPKEQIQKLINEVRESCTKDLRGLDFTGMDLEGAKLRETNLKFADFHQADLSYAEMRGVNLVKTDLWYADLEDARLREANLKNANLREANLADADLRGANLLNTNLGQARFKGILRLGNVRITFGDDNDQD